MTMTGPLPGSAHRRVGNPSGAPRPDLVLVQCIGASETTASTPVATGGGQTEAAFAVGQVVSDELTRLGTPETDR